MMMKRLLNILLILLIFALSGCYSCKTYHKFWGKGPVPESAVDKFFWEEECKPTEQPAKKDCPEEPAPVKAEAKEVPKPVAAKPAAKPAPKPAPAPLDTCGASVISKSFPCDDCQVIILNKHMPKVVRVNKPFEYQIKVTNVTDMVVTDVVVTDQISKNFTVTATEPEAQFKDGKLVWNFTSLRQMESRTLKISGIANTIECVKTCAAVTYYIAPACGNTTVVEPKLALVKEAPETALLCEPFAIKYIVTNPGTGTLENIIIEENLPDGLLTEAGNSKLTVKIDSLGEGRSRAFTTNLKASKTGIFNSKATAKAEDLKAQAQTKTKILQPILAISKTAPRKQYLRRPINYKIKVTNRGDAAAEEVVITDQQPAGTTLVSTSEGSTVIGDKIVWELGTIQAGESKTVDFALMANEAAVIENTVTATAICADAVSSTAKTNVAGISAVLLEVIDVEDPVEIGTTTTYIITATNQGTADDTNISIVCTLEANEQYVSSDGPTKAKANGNVITFAPLKSLAPKEAASWEVVVKAVKPGDVRFSVSMNTDQLNRPVAETEATLLFK
jgi:uncharacterized repeat protein (TIGR01451 family)